MAASSTETGSWADDVDTVTATLEATKVADAKQVSVESKKSTASEPSSTNGAETKPTVDTGASNPAETSKSEAAEADKATDKKMIEGLVDDLISHEVEIKLSEQQANESSPLHSVSSFEELGLKPELLKGVYALKFKKPSKIQEKALPLLLANPPRNMIGQSQSGTGKTAAFVLAMLSRVDDTLKAPQALCVSPTRELARQIGEVAKQMGQFTQCTYHLAIKDMDAPRADPIRDQVIIGTPGTVIDLVRRRVLALDKVKIYVVDEADVMLSSQGMGDQTIRIRKMLNQQCQFVLFSATFPDEVREFGYRVVPNPNEITLKREELSLDAIKQFYMDCKSFEHKFQILSQIYGLLTIGQSIVFCHTKNTADDLKRRMTADGHTVSVLHGDLQPNERDRVIDEFRSGQTKVLISTNVLSRGIDILQVSLVVNFDLPVDARGEPDPETYLHRIGRTGRFGRNGVTINFVHDRRSMTILQYIERFFGRTIQKIPTDDVEEIEKRLSTIQRS